MVMTDEKIQEILDGREVETLRALILNPDVDPEQRPRVVLGALGQLDALFDQSLPELLIRVCVEEQEDTAWHVRHYFLDSWVAGEGYYRRKEMVEDLIRRLRSSDGNQLVAAIRTAWIIGYRDETLISELVRIGGLLGDPYPDDQAQAYALAVLASLAYADPDAIARKLAARLVQNGGFNEADCWTALRVGHPGLIPALVQSAASTSVAVHALLELADRYPESATEVWNAFQGLSGRAQFGHQGTVAERIDLEEVGRYLTTETLRAFEQREKRNVLPPTTQLLRSNLPNHLRVFQEARETLGPNERLHLKRPAVAPTRNRQRVHTAATYNKECAWKVILRLGLAEARGWLPEAMEGEINFTLVELADLAGFLQVSEAVGPLATVVCDEAVDLGIGVGCLRNLGVIGTSEALEALLRSRVRIPQGGKRLIPAALVEATASACTSQRSCQRIWETLTDPLADPQLRELCAHTVEELSGFVDTPLPTGPELVHFLRSAGVGLPGFDQLVLAISRFDDTTAVDFLRDLALSDYESPSFIQALTFANLLAEFPERVRRLGFERRDTGWYIQGSLDDTSALALLTLYRSDPSFEPAMLQLLAENSFRPAVQVVVNLRKEDHLSPAIREALWTRALRWNGPNLSDSSALLAVARTQPAMLLCEETLSEVSRWGSPARRAYLAALRLAWKEHGNAGPVAQTACEFLVDEDREVRRDAARLARDTDRTALQSVVDRLATQAQELNQAVFTLEAAVWLETEWERYEGLGSSHREGFVRELVTRLTSERRQALLARDYLTKVLGSRDYLDTWCYGQALVEIGNEDTVEALLARLPQEVYRRAYQIWLGKRLEGRLQERRNKDGARTELPPPVSQERPVRVTVIVGQEILGPYSGVLQESQRQRARSWLSSWSVRIEGQSELLELLHAEDPISVVLDDGRHGGVMPVRSYSRSTRNHDRSSVLLLGQGALKVKEGE